jgi:hypothetical protein
MKDDLRSVQAEAGLRRCALVLHGLPQEDRQWLLAQLDPAHRDSLKVLVEDLNSLGMAPDPQLLRDLLGQVRRSPAAPVMRADDAELAQILLREPASLAALALKGHPDPERILALFDAPHRREVLSRRESHPGPVPPRLASCLREELDQRLRGRAVPMQGRRWSAVLQRLARVFQ